MKRTIIAILAVIALIESAFLTDAEARKHRKKKSAPPPPADTEGEVEEIPAEEGEEAENGDANDEAAPSEEGGDQKSLTQRLEDDGSEGSLRSSRRLEFDERLVKGQAAKSGAVYLFERMPRRLPGLVPLRRSYRRRIGEPILGPVTLKPATFSNEVVKEKKKKERDETLEEIKEAEESAAIEETPPEEKEKVPEENGKSKTKTKSKSKSKSKSRSKSASKSENDALIEEIEE